MLGSTSDTFCHDFEHIIFRFTRYTCSPASLVDSNHFVHFHILKYPLFFNIMLRKQCSSIIEETHRVPSKVLTTTTE